MMIQYSTIKDNKYAMVNEAVAHDTPLWQVAIIVFSATYFAGKVLQLW